MAHKGSWHTTAVFWALMKRFRKSHGRPFVRAREELHETKLEAAKLRENLVHEEFNIRVEEVYDFRCVHAACCLVHKCIALVATPVVAPRGNPSNTCCV